MSHGLFSVLFVLFCVYLVARKWKCGGLGGNRTHTPSEVTNCEFAASSISATYLIRS